LIERIAEYRERAGLCFVSQSRFAGRNGKVRRDTAPLSSQPTQRSNSEIVIRSFDAADLDKGEVEPSLKDLASSGEVPHPRMPS
jgi:hypothetical protein